MNRFFFRRRIRCRSLSRIAASGHLLMLCLCVAGCQSDQTKYREVDSWVRANAIALPNLDSSTDFPQLAFLEKAVEGKRVVFLAEAAHWVHEKWDYRLIMLKRLVSLGYTHIGMEMGLSDAKRVDHFLESGNLSDFEKVALYGYKSPSIRLRPQGSKCSIVKKTDPMMSKLFKSEEIWFYSQLRKMSLDALKNGQRIHYFGYDVDTVPGGIYEDLPTELARYKSDPPIKEFLSAFAQVSDETIDGEILRLDTLLEKTKREKSTWQKVVGDRQYSSVLLSVESLVESLRFTKVLKEEPCDRDQHKEWITQLMRAMAAREQMMFKVMAAKMDELGPDQKIVLMGHDMHLSLDPDTLSFVKADIPRKYAPMWPSIGQYVNRTLKIPTLSVWMIHSSGTQSNLNCPTTDCPVDSGPDYLGERLSHGGPFFLLPVSSASGNIASYFAGPLNFAVNGGTHSGNIFNNANLIFFVEKVNGMRSRAP